MQTSDFTCIDEVYTDNHVDLITLKDGRVVGISYECIVVYKDMDDFYNFTDNHVDLITLKDGRVVGISYECIVLYKDMDDFYNFDGKVKPTISLERA